MVDAQMVPDQPGGCVNSPAQFMDHLIFAMLSPACSDGAFAIPIAKGGAQGERLFVEL